MSRFHVDVTTDRRLSDARQTSAAGDSIFEELAEDAYSEYEEYEVDEFEDSRELDDWLAAELRLGRGYRAES